MIYLKKNKRIQLIILQRKKKLNALNNYNFLLIIFFFIPYIINKIHIIPRIISEYKLYKSMLIASPKNQGDHFPPLYTRRSLSPADSRFERIKRLHNKREKY